MGPKPALLTHSKGAAHVVQDAPWAWISPRIMRALSGHPLAELERRHRPLKALKLRRPPLTTKFGAPGGKDENKRVDGDGEMERATWNCDIWTAQRGGTGIARGTSDQAHARCFGADSA
eukprot:scaffold2618_cov240-Pinguiococcus_pyrenoidosus.AAC.4